MDTAKSGILNTLDHTGIYSAVLRREDGWSLDTVMAEMPLKLGRSDLSREEAEDLAEQIRHQVSRYTDLRDGIRSDSVCCVNAFLDRIDSYGSREQIMRDALRGLRLVEDGALPLELESKNGSSVYAELYGVDDKYSAMSYSELRNEFISHVGKSGLSPRLMDRVLKGLGESGDYVATAAAYGQKGYELKCLTAFHMYLTRNDMTVEQAAINTCLSTDLQAVGDAVRLGKRGATAARALVLAGTFAFIITAAELLMASTTMAAFLFSWCYIALVGQRALLALRALARVRRGEAAIVLGQLIRRGADASLQAWQSLKDRLACCRYDYGVYVDFDEEEDEEPGGRPPGPLPGLPLLRRPQNVTDPRF